MLLGTSLLSVSISDVLVDLSVPAAVVLGYFTFAKLFDSSVRGFISGTGPFAANLAEAAGKLQIACLPASVTRGQVVDALKERGPPMKLWEPEPVGLGKLWAAQGWVLWRWLPKSGLADTEGQPLQICWSDVPAVDLDQAAFSLAQVIASAAAKLIREN